MIPQCFVFYFQKISHDTIKFRFKLPSPDHILGLPVGQHVTMSAKVNGDRVVRSYTPITPDDVKGYVDFVIKVYKPNEKFPNGGVMSQYLSKLQPGISAIDFLGPLGKIIYLGNGVFQIKESAKEFRNITVTKLSLVAGGTGITPMFQLIQKILQCPKDSTKIALLFANNTEDDILLRDEIDSFAREHGDQFRRWYTIATAPTRWEYGQGFITKQMLEEHINPPADDNLVLICGPPPMIKLAVSPNLESIGHKKELCLSY
ncbi:NADH-cytochrome b5 reductase 2 [Cichlidogyrus casuarinus]|uniref:NADH-cytochrome b5 reductase n=1 Tax=Cichlidogyrus casuarinus TaxID=1844966 RepID=A0ABD2Q7I8_9PLAT